MGQKLELTMMDQLSMEVVLAKLRRMYLQAYLCPGAGGAGESVRGNLRAASIHATKALSCNLI